MGKKTRAAVRTMLARTRWARERNLRDAFFLTRELIRAPEPIIFDVGAHVGETAQRYRSLFPRAIIHCFEPYAPSIERLAAAHSADARVLPHSAAVSDSTGTATLRVNRASVTNSLLESDRRGDRYWGAGLLETETEVMVPTITLDDFCANEAVSHIDILKVDVQGAEHAVLAGATRLLSSHAIDLLYMEMLFAPSYVGQRKYHEYFALLDGLGYALFGLFNLGHRDGRLIQADAIFVTPPLLERYEQRKASAPDPRRV